MKNFSLPRLGLLLWFANFSFFCVVDNYLIGGRHSIFTFLVYSAVCVAVELLVFGWLEDVL
ncbi:MAG TPA: hypothetical protein VFR02_04495 [bacterium]|nr:hypothetical protein [bacterium]